MDFTMDAINDPFDFNSFINWPDELAPADHAAEGVDG